MSEIIHTQYWKNNKRNSKKRSIYEKIIIDHINSSDADASDGNSSGRYVFRPDEI